MSNNWPVPVSLLFLIFLHGCSPSSAQTRDVDTAESWLQEHGHPLAMEAENFDDLQFLKPLLEGKRIVQLGESTHGVREFNLLKARIVRFLHQELGYDVLAFESALYQCYDADLAAGESSAGRTLTGCAFGVWHTKEVLPLFEYLRQTHDSERPLNLAGFDIQPIGRNKEGRPQFLSDVVASINADYAAEVLALDSTFLEVYARDGSERRSYFMQETGQDMAEAYDRLAAFLADNASVIEAAAIAPDRILFARQTAASMANYVRQQSSPTVREHFERRDQGMAENLMFLLDEAYPDHNVIVWGHNLHLRHDNLAILPDSTMYPDVAVRTTGSWIYERYGDAVYTVGLYMYQGQAANNRGMVFEIEPALPGSLEELLHKVGTSALFVDLSQAPRQPMTTWMDQPITARFNGATALQMVLRDQYSAILFVDRVTPRVMMY